MIIQETYRSEWHDRPLVRTYSDRRMMIRQNETGIEYAEAIDVPNRYTYTETETPVPKYDDPEQPN